MEQDKIVTIKEQIISNVQYGDFQTLSKMLNIKPANAKMRFRRSKEDAVLAMKKITENRSELVKFSTILYQDQS
jgi:hypothetical protein